MTPEDYVPRHRKDMTPPAELNPEYNPDNLTRPIEVWSEGYAANEGRFCAMYHGISITRSFDQAVINLFGINEPLLKRAPDGSWSYWGCRLFDNEADARKSFG